MPGRRTQQHAATVGTTAAVERAATEAVIAQLRESPRVPLAAACAVPERSGYYLLFARLEPGPDHPGLRRLYRPVDGSRPIYVGSSTTTPLHQRLRRHRQSLAEGDGLDPASTWVVTVPCGTPWALLGEATVARVLFRGAVPWNAVRGFGSRNQGRSRVKGQPACTPWDALHPGRHWQQEPSEAGRLLAVLDVARSLTFDAGSPPLWKPLPVDSGRGGGGRRG